MKFADESSSAESNPQGRRTGSPRFKPVLPAIVPLEPVPVVNHSVSTITNVPHPASRTEVQTAAKPRSADFTTSSAARVPIDPSANQADAATSIKRRAAIHLDPPARTKRRRDESTSLRSSKQTAPVRGPRQIALARRVTSAATELSSSTGQPHQGDEAIAAAPISSARTNGSANGKAESNALPLQSPPAQLTLEAIRVAATVSPPDVPTPAAATAPTMVRHKPPSLARTRLAPPRPLTPASLCRWLQQQQPSDFLITVPTAVPAATSRPPNAPPAPPLPPAARLVAADPATFGAAIPDLLRDALARAWREMRSPLAWSDCHSPGSVVAPAAEPASGSAALPPPSQQLATYSVVVPGRAGSPPKLAALPDNLPPEEAVVVGFIAALDLGEKESSVLDMILSWVHAVLSSKEAATVAPVELCRMSRTATALACAYGQQEICGRLVSAALRNIEDSLRAAGVADAVLSCPSLDSAVVLPGILGLAVAAARSSTVAALPQPVAARLSVS
ncbi:hypothetical protein HK405_013521, partial [Cladochytrium tenue]